MAAQESSSVKPPRPPNSWILYRAFMMKKLQPKDSQERRLSQSEMSSLIGSMWRNATADVKREFEEMAERLKLEHQAKYPGYKYQPRKKEEKERAKEVQKQQRAAQKRDTRSKRGVSSSSSSMPPAPIQPMVNPYYNPHMLNLASALSPPLSAAASPPSSDSLNPPTPLLLHATPLPLASPQPSHPTSATLLGSEPLTASQLLMPPVHLQQHESYLPSPSVTPAPQELITYLPSDASGSVHTAPTPKQDNAGLPWPIQSSSDGHDQNDFLLTNTLSFDVGNNWSDMLDPELASFLSNPTPGLFQVQGLDTVDFGSSAGGELELSIPDIHVSQDVATFLRAYGKDGETSGSTLHTPVATSFAQPDQFDFSALLNPYSDSADVAIHNMGFFDHSFSTNHTYPYDEHVSPIEPSPASLDVTATLSPAHMHIPTPATTSSYVPPAGAAHSSSRRVGGNWSRPPFISA